MKRTRPMGRTSTFLAETVFPQLRPGDRDAFDLDSVGGSDPATTSIDLRAALAPAPNGGTQ